MPRSPSAMTVVPDQYAPTAEVANSFWWPAGHFAPDSAEMNLSPAGRARPDVDGRSPTRPQTSR